MCPLILALRRASPTCKLPLLRKSDKNKKEEIFEDSVKVKADENKKQKIFEDSVKVKVKADKNKKQKIFEDSVKVLLGGRASLEGVKTCQDKPVEDDSSEKKQNTEDDSSGKKKNSTNNHLVSKIALVCFCVL